MGKKIQKLVTEMTADELAKETAEADREFIIDAFDPPDVDAKRRLARAKRKRGRPQRGQGVKVISLTVERRLLRRTDAPAKKLKVSWSRLVEVGLRKILQDAG